jgi:hypothetical protein
MAYVLYCFVTDNPMWRIILDKRGECRQCGLRVQHRAAAFNGG